MTGPDLVVASSYGSAGASSRVRALEWLSVLGLHADVLDYLGTSDVRPGTLARDPLGVLRAERRLRRVLSGRAPDRLLVSRSMTPLAGGRVEAALLRRAGWGVYDFDDALYADDRGGIHRFLGEAAGWDRAVRAADLVIAGNTYLAEAAAERGATVTIIPSCVHPAAYVQKKDYTVDAPPRLIWVGSPSTERYLEAVAPALLTVHRRTGARLTVVSAGDRPLGDLAAMTDRVRWDGARTDALLAEADCGIMPLPDEPFTRGKCAYKLLQYGAAGLPSVASPVGVNAQVLDELGGLAADSTDEWADALLALLEECEPARRARGSQARAAVEARYSYAAWGPVFLRALRLDDDRSARDTAPSSSADPLR